MAREGEWAWTISLAGLVVLPLPFDTFVNATVHMRPGTDVMRWRGQSDCDTASVKLNWP
jgi:hypothetical protein